MKVHIIGGGFSGITLAYFLKKLNFEVIIYEKEHWGGALQTIVHRGALIETAASGFLNSHRFEELNNDIKAPIRGAGGSQARYIYSRGSPRRWPLRLRDHLSLLIFIFKMIFFKNLLKAKPFETVARWVERALSNSILTTLVEPALRGIYAGSVDRMSASLIFGRWFNEAPRPKSPNKKGLQTGILGMEGWVQSLTEFLRVQGVEFKIEGVETLQDFAPEKDKIILATGPIHAAQLLKTINDQRFEILEKIEMIPIASVTVLTEKPTLLQGFGCLFPAKSPFHSFGVLFRQSFFPEKGAPDQERWILPWKGESNDEILSHVDQDRASLWNQLAPKIQAHHIKCWPQALPHYTVDLERQIIELNLISKTNSKIFLHGNYLGSLGLTAILDRSYLLAQEIKDSVSY